MTNDELRAAIKADFSQAWLLNDRAHREEHFQEVETTGLIIRDRLRLEIGSQEIMLVAWFHDLFAWSRHNHHILSYTWMMTNNWEPLRRYRHIRRRIAQACKEHRASYRGEFFSPLSELMNAADRERPGNVEAMIQRSIKYHEDKGLAPGNERAGAVKHIKEKFGTQGYARYPAMYEEAFGDELKRQREEIDALVD